LWPANNDWQPAAEGVDIWVVSNPVHSDIVMPIATDVIDWRDVVLVEQFVGNPGGASHVSIGWGDRGFFLQTRRWADLKLSTTCRALLWPSPAVLHVDFWGQPVAADHCRRVRLSAEQYGRLVDFIKQSFALDPQGQPQPIDHPGYNWSDGFFEGTGNYHAYNTCNCWVANALETAGVRVPWFSPLPRTVFSYLPAN
jgi:uncharacterized protein (TIGR02117 family)